MNYDVKINFMDKLPKSFKELMEEAEASWEADDGAYYNHADSIEVSGKMMVEAGDLSYAEWETLQRRYC